MRRALLFLLLTSTPAWADCPLDLGHGTGIVIFSDQYMLALRPDPLRLEIGQPFALLMNVCTKAGEPAELVGVQADGLAATGALPNVKPGKEGRYRVEGLLLPSAGSWEIAFDVRTGGDMQRLTHDLVVK